jgi:formylglycine-generating enzyme required for sulfatase activity
VGVSWEDAQRFCRWAGCRLPTEAEWEYACRAGSQKKYCFGDDVSRLEEFAWFNKNSGGKLHPVGEKKPNAWGLFDLHGNVWEWCQDWWKDDYYKHSPKTDPAGPERGSARVLRGGSFRNDPDSLRCSSRSNYDPDIRGHYIGFRVVCAGASAG